MIQALVGNAFLVHEAARARLRGLGGGPWLDDDVTPALVVSHLQNGLFGPAILVVDMGEVKDYKAVLASALSASEATVLLVDPEPDANDPESSRKKIALDFRANEYAKHGEVLRLQTPARGALNGWIVARAKKMGLTLDRDAAGVLAEAFPNDLAAVVSELNKLVDMPGPLTSVDVASIVNLTPPGNLFTLLDAASAGDALNATRQLKRLLDAGEEPFRVLASLEGAFLLTVRAVGLRELGRLSDEEAGKRLGTHPFRAKKALAAAAGLNERRAREMSERVLQADVDMKAGLDPRLTLERLVLDLSSRPAAGKRGQA